MTFSCRRSAPSPKPGPVPRPEGRFLAELRRQELAEQGMELAAAMSPQELLDRHRLKQRREADVDALNLPREAMNWPEEKWDALVRAAERTDTPEGAGRRWARNAALALGIPSGDLGAQSTAVLHDDLIDAFEANPERADLADLLTRYYADDPTFSAKRWRDALLAGREAEAELDRLDAEIRSVAAELRAEGYDPADLDADLARLDEELVRLA